MSIRFLCAAVLIVPLRVGAQWHVALLGGTATTQGDSRDTLAADHAEIRADRMTVATLAIERAGEAWRVGAELRRLTGDLSEVTASASIDARGVVSAWGAAVTVRRRITPGMGAALWALVGAGADRWSFDLAGGDPRWRLALHAALESEFPVGGDWSVLVRAGVTAGPSIFREDEVAEGFTRQTALRPGYAVGLARRWR
ncbi:MAG: hypothetical protein ACREL5_11160 [Gemmatimonadales bacterium]